MPGVKRGNEASGIAICNGSMSD